jgi:UMP-CMP kinase
MIQNTIKEGKIVPSEVTVRLLQKAMEECNSNNFLIDGFPRNEENRAVFEHVTGIEPEFILFFDCPEEEMEKRILSRNQGREDDNLETIRKRFKVFLDSTVPIVNHYETTGKVRKVLLPPTSISLSTLASLMNLHFTIVHRFIECTHFDAH